MAAEPWMHERHVLVVWVHYPSKYHKKEDVVDPPLVHTEALIQFIP